MSDAVSALPGATFSGFARVEDAGLRGMITLRGDPGSEPFCNAVTAISGTAFPATGRIEVAEARALAWMSPDEVLLLCPYGDVPGLVSDLGTALSGTHHLVANVSDSRTMISVIGEDVREVIGKLTPADLSPGAFGEGVFRRSRLAQVPAAFWITDDSRIDVICFRSVARYVFDLLATSARQGSEVGFH